MTLRPGYIDTPMMARFTGGTGEEQSKVISQVPIGGSVRPSSC